MSLFVCPICGAALEREPGRYRCPAGHSYDVAREGYTHLLPANRKHSKMPGDDKGMAAARSAFLSKDYYAALRDALCRLALDYAPEHPAVLDTGCGEGYYTSAVYRALRDAGKAPCMAGTDISKAILRRAAKREKDVEFAVASSYHLPVADRSIDLLLNCFSPLALEEFRRALRPGGTFLYVVPSEKHLWELKQVLYDHPYPNEVKETPYEGFAYAEIRHVEDRIRVLGQEDIHALFQMTPYYWKTPKSGCQRLAALEELAVNVWDRKPNIKGYRMADGRILNLLAEGRLVNLAAGNGHPAEIMDMSFALQAKSLEYLARSGRELAPGVYQVPREIDREVAELKLRSMGVSIDTLTDEQYAYLHS